MPLRMRWYEFPYSGDVLHKLGRKMLADPYRAGQAAGFRMTVVRRDELEGAYIERREYTEQIEDPFGEYIRVPRLEFRQVVFRVRSGAPLLELIDSGRDARLLLERVNTLSGGGIHVRPLSVDVRLWLRHLEAQHGTVTVLGARLTDLTLSTSAAASVTVKGTQDIRGHIEDLLRGRQGTIERIHLELKRRPGLVNIELTGDARAVVHQGGDSAGALAADAIAAAVTARGTGTKASFH